MAYYIPSMAALVFNFLDDMHQYDISNPLYIEFTIVSSLSRIDMISLLDVSELLNSTNRVYHLF